MNDAWVFDKPGGMVSDILRFEPRRGLRFYLDQDAVGLPVALSTNNVSIVQWQRYVPITNGTGYALDAGGSPMASEIRSDEHPVLEPIDIALFGQGPVAPALSLSRARLPRPPTQGLGSKSG